MTILLNHCITVLLFVCCCGCKSSIASFSVLKKNIQICHCPLHMLSFRVVLGEVCSELFSSLFGFCISLDQNATTFWPDLFLGVKCSKVYHLMFWNVSKMLKRWEIRTNKITLRHNMSIFPFKVVLFIVFQLHNLSTWKLLYSNGSGILHKIGYSETAINMIILWKNSFSLKLAEL